jgi:uncharacterized Zn finger protein (UPF0148 family)
MAEVKAETQPFPEERSMNTETCELCGCPLEVCEGASYCPDCTYYHAVEQMDRATDEALAVLALEHAAYPEMDAEELPF